MSYFYRIVWRGLALDLSAAPGVCFTEKVLLMTFFGYHQDVLPKPSHRTAENSLW